MSFQAGSYGQNFGQAGVGRAAYGQAGMRQPVGQSAYGQTGFAASPQANAGYGVQQAPNPYSNTANSFSGFSQTPAYSAAKPVAKPAAAWGQAAAAPKPLPNAWQQSWAQQQPGWQSASTPKPKPAAPITPSWQAQPAMTPAFQQRLPGIPSGIRPAVSVPRPGAAVGVTPAVRPWAASTAPPVQRPSIAPKAKPGAVPSMSAVQAARLAVQALQQGARGQAAARRASTVASAARTPILPQATALQQAQQALAKQRALAQVQKLQQQRAALAKPGAAAAKPGATVAKPVAKPAGRPAPAITPSVPKPKAAPKPVSKPAPPAPKPPSWVEQLGKLVMNPWPTVHRPALDLLRRFPTLDLSPDLVSITCHYGTDDWRGLVQTNPLAETLTLDEEKDQISETEPELQGDPKRIVRVALLTGKLLGIPAHLANRIQFVLHKTNQPACLPGAPWDAAKDGKDPDKLATLKKTAVRALKAFYGLDLEKLNFHRFMDIKYSTEEGPVHTTILLPELWSVKDLPLGLGRVVKEVEQEEVRKESVEEPLNEDDIAAANKAWNDRIERQRKAGQAPRPNEREADRVERLERLEETLKELDKTRPPMKETKTVVKEIKEMKTVKQPLCRPAFLSLNTIRELSMPKTGAVTSIFETKLFALCFDELVRLEAGTEIMEWFQVYKERAKVESEARISKHKRDFDQIQERDKIIKERLAKKQKLDQEKKAAELVRLKSEKEKEGLREAERLERELMEKEKEPQKAPASADEEPEEDPSKPLPPLRLKKLVYELDESSLPPFLFFDSAVQAPCGNMARSDLLQIFHRTGETPQREVQELLKVSLMDTPAARNVGVGMFSYRGACSIQREVEPEEEPPATEAKATEKDAMEVAK